MNNSNALISETSVPQCKVFKTTYQKHYCPMDERNNGKRTCWISLDCKCLKTKVHILVFPHLLSCLFRFRPFPDDCPCPKSKILRQKGCEKCFKHCELKNRNPDDPDKKKRRISEYMDTTSRIGDLILKHRLNDHRKCGRKGTRCQHIFYLDWKYCI